MKKYILFITLSLFIFQTLWGQSGKRDSSAWTLKQCIAYAHENSITVKQAVLNRNSAEITYHQSKSALLPSVNASGSQSLTQGTSIDPITSDFVSKVINSTSLGLNAQATIFNGFQQTNQIKQNKLLVKQNEYLIEEAKKDITLNIIQSYIQVLYLKEEVKIAESNLTLCQHQLEVIADKYNAGTLDVKTFSDAQSQVATNNYNLVVAKNAVANQVLTLKQLLELPSNIAFELAEDSLISPTASIVGKETVMASALTNLPEIKAAETEIEANSMGLKIAKGGYYPTLAVSGNLSTGYTSTQAESFANQFNNNFNQSIALRLNVPIWDNNTTKSRVQNAKIQIQKSQYNLYNAQKEITQKIESLWLNSAAAQSQTEAALAQREASKTAFEIAQRQFDLGASSYVDLQLSMNNYLSASQKYIVAKHTLLIYQLMIQYYNGIF